MYGVGRVEDEGCVPVYARRHVHILGHTDIHAFPDWLPQRETPPSPAPPLALSHQLLSLPGISPSFRVENDLGEGLYHSSPPAYSFRGQYCAPSLLPSLVVELPFTLLPHCYGLSHFLGQQLELHFPPLPFISHPFWPFPFLSLASS